MRSVLEPVLYVVVVVEGRERRARGAQNEASLGWFSARGVALVLLCEQLVYGIPSLIFNACGSHIVVE